MRTPIVVGPPDSVAMLEDKVKRPSAAARLVVGMIHVYQAGRRGRPSPCRYLPTCSSYAIEAIEHHGAARGSILALRRVLGCHPWGGHGFDPVPE